jgi:S-methylmethionine-dependent homocysteine/selenocysteine methylase
MASAYLVEVQTSSGTYRLRTPVSMATFLEHARQPTNGVTMPTRFAPQQSGLNYLTEGGQETEIMYKYGFDLPHFAVFPLLDDPRAVAELRAMYERYLDTAAAHAFGVIMGGFDYRASPDWAALLGYSSATLAEMQLRCIDFLRDVSRPYGGQVPVVKYAGIVGPRGDAYELNRTITAEEAEEYHGVQVATLARSGVDLVEAMTFNDVPEVVGLSRAAARAGLPLAVSFTLDNSTRRLASGLTLKDAIESIDAQTGEDRPAFYGINCSHPLEFAPAIEPGTWFERVRCLRPNAAMMDKMSLCTLGHLEAGDPEQLGQLMGELADKYPHIDIWGGCCGTWDTHLDNIARNVVSVRGKQVPDYA